MMNLPFIHLKTYSSFSLTESTIKIPTLVKLAKNNKMPAIALTDNNNMFGVLEFSLECQKEGIQPIIGTSINLLDIYYNNQFPQLTFLIKDEEGYKNLLYLSTISHTNKSHNVGISINDLINHSKGLICFVGGELNPLLFYKLQNNYSEINDFINKMKHIFNDNFYFELQRINNEILDEYESELINIAYDSKISLIASNNIKFVKQEDHEAHDALLCISHKSTINQENRIKSNPNLYFKNTSQMFDLFHDIPEVIENNFYLAVKCQFYPKEVKPKLPKFITKNNITEEKFLIQMSKKGLLTRLDYINFDKTNNNLTKEKYSERLEYELNIINRMGFAGYFLIVADFVQWAKKNDIPVGPGRGSGAGSVVAWSLTITDLDPLKYGLLFERFLNPERVSMPDFDIDFCQNRRDEVIEYVNEKYGSKKVAHIITFGTLASRAAVRDVGRVLEVPYSEVDKFAKLIPYNPSNPLNLNDSINSDINIKNIIKNDERISNIIETSLKLEGLHRHASTHAAGVVIGDENLIERVPLYKDPNTAVNATQFSMKYVEKAGLIKFDFLGLTTLSIINDTIRLIKNSNPNFSLDQISLNDKKTFKELSKGDAVGVFQLESSGMSNVLQQLQPDKFEEIIAVVALFRPGPMENIPSFCNRKHKKENIDYIHPLLESILKETYGIIVYQEQVMQIAQVLSNYSLGEADLLRRAMGKKIQKEMDAQKNRFIKGAEKNGINMIQASYIFDLVDKFAGYGFNKSHAAGYALIAYQTAYLKTNFPLEFMTTSLNYSIDRTDRIILLKKELDKLNIPLLKPDINFSKSKFTIENDQNNSKSIRFGLSAIKGVGINSMKKLEKNRKKMSKFTDIIDFMTRLDSDIIHKRQLEKLIQAGAFDSIEERRSLLFNNVTNFVHIYGNKSNNFTNQSSFFKYDKINFNDKKIFSHEIEKWSLDKKLINELEVIGFYFSDHPLSSYPKVYFDEIGVVNFEKIISDDSVKNCKLVGSILDIKERSNRDGKKYAFITVSNLKSQFEITVFHDALRLYKDLIKEGNVLIFHVDISRDSENKRIIVRKIENLKQIFNNHNFKINLFLSNINEIELLKDFVLTSTNKSSLFVFLEKKGKLISFDLSNKFEISNYSKLDKLCQIKKINYSLEIH